MCRRLLDISRASGIRRIVSLVLDENFAMRRVLRKLGFKLEWRLGEDALRATLDLEGKGGKGISLN
jgi:RimJ/RimL family protein N-acetyltransferase